jgi:hypothetical protein
VYTTSGCQFTKTCEDLDLWDDYISQYQIYVLYMAAVFHTVLWFFVLRIIDVMKDGGTFKEAVKFSVSYLLYN